MNQPQPRPQAPAQWQAPNEAMARQMRQLGIHIAAGSRIICPNVTIGAHTRINGPILIKGSGVCRIGRYCALGDGIRIITSNHDMTAANMQVDVQNRHGFRELMQPRQPVEVGHNAWVGDAVILLPGAKLGPGAVVGAGAVVTKELPPFAVAVGNPARVLRLRFAQEIIDQLLEIAWWDWDEARIGRNAALFNADLTADPELDLSTLVAP